MAPKTDKRPFNVAFGKALRGCRILYGYERAEDFAPKIEEATGLKFQIDTLRRIESGRKGATVEQYTAISLTLTGNVSGLMLGRTLSILSDETNNAMVEAYKQGIERDRLMAEIDEPRRK